MSFDPSTTPTPAPSPRLTTMRNTARGPASPTLRLTGSCVVVNGLTLRFSTKSNEIGPIFGHRAGRLMHKPFEWGRSGET
jgi:hypothetical protein